MSDELFKMPDPILTQRKKCKKCKESVTENEYAYCEKHDLPLRFEINGTVAIDFTDQRITCDGGLYTEATD